MRELKKADLIDFLHRKVGRWESIWWNGELISIAQALGRAHELLPSECALCSHDEVLLPGHLERATQTAPTGPRC